MKVFFKLIRLPNLLFIIYTQILLRFALFPLFNFTPTLTFLQFIFLTLSIVIIAAAGYIINDIQDLEIDRTNKPKQQILGNYISIEKAKQYYKVSNAIGLLFAAILSLQTQKPSLLLIFILVVYGLFWYSKKIKSVLFISNLLIAVFVALTIPFQLFFENSIPNVNLKLSVFFLTLFAFSINLVRELVKDIEDINGDRKLKLKTIPIVLGRDRALKIAATLLLFPVFLCFYLLINYPSIHIILTIYTLILIVLPLVFIYYKLITLKTYNSIKTISNLLKIVMFFGINIILIFSLIA